MFAKQGRNSGADFAASSTADLRTISQHEKSNLRSYREKVHRCIFTILWQVKYYIHK